MARLSMTILADHGGVAVVVLADLLPHGGIFVDPCGGDEGGGVPMNPHSGSSGVSRHSNQSKTTRHPASQNFLIDSNDERASPGTTGRVLVLAPRGVFFPMCTKCFLLIGQNCHYHNPTLGKSHSE